MADVRTGLITALGALGAAGGLAYTARTFRLSQVAHLTGRFQSVSKQMGDDDPMVRVAGIHAMAQLADEWPGQRQTCIDVLCAFLRVNSTRSDDLRQERRTTLRIIKEHLRQEHGRVSWQECEFDLTGAVLKEADFSEFTFAGARFIFDKVQFEEGVSFDKSIFTGGCVSFRGAKLLKPKSRVSFVKALFRGGKVVFDGVTFGDGEVHFDNAVFGSLCLVTFKDAQLGAGGSVYFTGATAQGPGLSFADASFCPSEKSSLVEFDRVTFSETVHFDRAKFQDDVNFGNATLTGANLIFTGAELIGGRVSFDSAHFVDSTMNIKGVVAGAGRIDLRARADGTPEFISDDPVPGFVQL
ncbi:MAG: pentapeptide repeat-containing protein [Pseudonocardiaceae bacterium]